MFSSKLQNLTDVVVSMCVYGLVVVRGGGGRGEGIAMGVAVTRVLF